MPAASDPFVAHLKQLCTSSPTRAKWVLVPSHALGRTLADRLVLEGTNWANLHVVTPYDIALRMGAPFLVERGIDPSDEGLGPALIMRLMLELPGASDTGYFRPLIDQPPMAQALWSTIQELRMAGVRASNLPAAAFESAVKHAELSALLVAYEHFLESKQRGDRATLFAEALRHPDWCPISAGDCRTELPGVIWSPLESALIAALPGEAMVPQAITARGAVVPRRLTAAPSMKTAKAAEVFGSAVTMFHAGGAEAEVEEVFRRIAASGRSLDEVEIACASERYASLIWDKACRYNWKVTLAAGLPVTLTRPGRALIAFTSWVESDFTAGHLRRLLQSGDVRVSDVVSPGRAGNLLAKAQASWGRDTYAPAFARMVKSDRRHAARDEMAEDARASVLKRADDAEVVAAWVASLLTSVPTADGEGRIAFRDLAACARSFVETRASTSSALDGSAAEALKSAVADLDALDSFTCTLTEGLRFLRERVDGLRVGADRPRPGCLHVSRLSAAAYANRPLLFVIGLEEGRVFPAAIEDSVLLDAEREAIHSALPCSGDRIDESVYAVLTRLASAGVSGTTAICLSYSCRDLREFRETHPSWLLLQAHRVISGKPRDSYAELQKALGPPKSVLPDDAGHALSESAWWLHGLVKAGAAGAAAVTREYPSLAAGLAAEKARASVSFGEYDGHVPAAGKVLDPCAANDVVSSTQLEAVAECPFRHFLERGLGVRVLEERERESDLWLDPMTRGSVLHDLYAEMLRKCRAEKRRPKLNEDSKWLRALAMSKLADLRVEMPPPTDEVYVRETDAVLADLDLFLAEEVNTQSNDRTPVGMEVAFGKASHHPDDDGSAAEPLAQTEPIVVDLGGGLKFRLVGRIDRIDQIGPASFEIIDYKTGGFWPDNWGGTFAGGTMLQHALYGLAATELLRKKYKNAKVERGTYYFPSMRGRRERVSIPASSKATTIAVLADLRQVIADGLFLHARDEDSCRFCELSPACGADTAVEQANNKINDAVLAPVVRLASHG